MEKQTGRDKMFIVYRRGNVDDIIYPIGSFELIKKRLKLTVLRPYHPMISWGYLSLTLMQGTGTQTSSSANIRPRRIGTPHSSGLLCVPAFTNHSAGKTSGFSDRFQRRRIVTKIKNAGFNTVLKPVFSVKTESFIELNNKSRMKNILLFCVRRFYLMAG